MNIRFRHVSLAAFTLAAGWSAPVVAADAARPNIICILSDDVGLGDIACCGGPFKTPRIDALAAAGLRFENAYSTPLCGPTRCQLLTGRYPFRTGLNSNQSRDAVDPKDEVMIPSIMKKAGYATASCGKWGQICLGPGEWGFDEYLVFKGSGRYWASQSPDYVVNGKTLKLGPQEYLPEVMHRFATDFITRHRDGPFFLYYPMSHIHGPILRTPDSKPGAGPDRLYQDNVESMDQYVGKLMDELDRLHLREKTLVIFTGDNGTARFGVTAATVHGKAISGQKGTMLEGGAHVPFVASWPGVTPAGKVTGDLIDFTDLLTTFADLGGAALPEGVVLDGRSFAPQLRGEKGLPRDWVYVELNGRSHVRNARYKLGNDGRLFDLKNAPYEEIPIAADSSDPAAAAARKELQAVLDKHPAAPGGEKRGVKKNKQGRNRRPAR
ncbi:MAG: sulfatase-like hydrolase/transferase [Kiritimatiellia bacterium]